MQEKLLKQSLIPNRTIFLLMIKITKTTGLILFQQKFQELVLKVVSQVDKEVQARISLARTSNNSNHHKQLQYKEGPMCLCPR